MNDLTAFADAESQESRQPPRSNGELVFDEPWQSRAFGLAAAAVEAGHFTWSQFQKYLIPEIANHDKTAGSSPTQLTLTRGSTAEPAGYYGCWLAALERLLADSGKAPQAEVDALATQYASREPGHDH